MYNYLFLLTYNNISDTFLSNEQYKKDLLNVFSLQSYNHKKIMNEINILYDKLKKNTQIKELLTNIKLNNHTLTFLLDNESSFIILFSFEYFNYFHVCLSYLLTDKPINEDYFRKFISFIQK